MIQLHCVVLYQQGTQQENFAMKKPSLDDPLTATLGRVNEPSFPVTLIGCYYELRETCRLILRRE